MEMLSFFKDAYAKSRGFFRILKGIIIFRIQFCICWAPWDTYSVTVRHYVPHATSRIHENTLDMII